MDTIMKLKYIFNYLIIAIFKVHLRHNPVFIVQRVLDRETLGSATRTHSSASSGPCLLGSRTRLGSPHWSPVQLVTVHSGGAARGDAETRAEVTPALRHLRVSMRPRHQNRMKSGQGDRDKSAGWDIASVGAGSQGGEAAGGRAWGRTACGVGRGEMLWPSTAGSCFPLDPPAPGGDRGNFTSTWG